MRVVTLSCGTTIPAIGQGTWHMGESGGDHAAEVDALRLGLDLGMQVIDTAEMYADGGSEQVVGRAIAGRRDEVFLVSKLYPQNASRTGTRAACERSLSRLGTDRLDLYLLHWRGAVPLAETVAAFGELQAEGKILRWGVSNLDVDDMEELLALPGGDGCASNQILYNPGYRGVEFDLLPWCAARHMAVMAYSPVGQGGRLLTHAALRDVAHSHGATPAQVALAWALRHPHVVAIPKATQREHVRQNAAAAAITLTAGDLAALDSAFPPPQKRRALDML